MVNGHKPLFIVVNFFILDFCGGSGYTSVSANIVWGKLFKNGPSKICGRQSLKKFEVI